MWELVTVTIKFLLVSQDPGVSGSVCIVGIFADPRKKVTEL